MQGIERNRLSYNTLQRQQKEQALAQEWQKQNDSKNYQLNQHNQLKKSQDKQPTQQSSATHRSQQIGRVQSIQSVDDIHSNDTIDIDSTKTKPHYINFEEAERFNLQEDLVDFVKPQHNNPASLSKDSLIKTGEKVMLHLELVGASEALMKRAETLFKEEENVKSVMNAYKNALVFT